MTPEEVPQDHSLIYGGHRKALYATGEGGDYRVVASSGWGVEQQVTAEAVDEFRRLAALALAGARAGTTTALEYRMYDRRMDVRLLAETTGFAAWRVRRHLRPAVFQRLSPARLQRYAEALGMTVASLKSLPP